MQNRPQNAKRPLKPLKWYKDLARKKGRLEAKAFIVEGPRAVAQLLHNNPDLMLEIMYTGELPSEYRNYVSRQITEMQLRSICSTQTPQSIAAVMRLPDETYSDQVPHDPGVKILLLEDVQDPGNVGTLVRTAVSFGFSGLILSDKCADPFSPKCVQSTAGTTLSLWIRRTAGYLELAAKLKNAGYILVATDLSGIEDFSPLRQSDKLILALGNEASGLSKSILQLSDHRLRIPINSDRAESLNVAACGAICLFLSSCK